MPSFEMTRATPWRVGWVGWFGRRVCLATIERVYFKMPARIEYTRKLGEYRPKAAHKGI
jgi:hypothetical protein